MKIVTDDSAGVAAWVNTLIPELRGFGPCAALGVTDKDGKPLMGIVYHDYQPQWGTMQFTLAAASPKWCHRTIIRHLLAYPFKQVGVFKLWGAHEHTNTRAQRISKGLGFTQEATLAHHFGQSHHAVISRMLQKDYFRLYGEKNENPH